MKKIVFFVLSICLLVINGCNTSTTNNSSKNSQCDSSLVLKHAMGFEVNYHSNYKELVVHSPWVKGDVMARYYLVDNNNTPTPSDGTRILTPISNIATTSCTHIEFINRIGEIESISGVSTPNLIYNPTIREKFENASISNIGDAFSLNLERIMVLRTNAVMLSSYNEHDENSRRLEQTGIPVIFNNEWTESTLLARAEWIKFVACFFNKEQLASDIYDSIESNYASIVSEFDTIANKPSILVGGNFKGTWYVPGGRSYMGRLFADAGSDYFYKNDSNYQSIPLNFETILLNFKNAEIWLNAPCSSMKELYSIDEKHKLFSSAINNRVYSFNRRLNDDGANDFWESGLTNPDLVLKDIIWALYPDRMSEYMPTYILHLK